MWRGGDVSSVRLKTREMTESVRRGPAGRGLDASGLSPIRSWTASPMVLACQKGSSATAATLPTGEHDLPQSPAPVSLPRSLHITEMAVDQSYKAMREEVVRTLDLYDVNTGYVLVRSLRELGAQCDFDRRFFSDRQQPWV